jgi:hypothetical protein
MSATLGASNAFLKLLEIADAEGSGSLEAFAKQLEDELRDIGISPESVLQSRPPLSERESCVQFRGKSYGGYVNWDGYDGAD